MTQNSKLDFKIQHWRLDLHEQQGTTKVDELRIVRKGVSNACIPLHAKT
jgi:hypothetical protein